VKFSEGSDENLLGGLLPRLMAIHSFFYRLFTVTTRVGSTIGSMPDDEKSRSGANLLLLCLAALIFSAVLLMGFELTALP
jgi:hypothetical protein